MHIYRIYSIPVTHRKVIPGSIAVPCKSHHSVCCRHDICPIRSANIQAPVIRGSSSRRRCPRAIITGYPCAGRAGPYKGPSGIHRLLWFFLLRFFRLFWFLWLLWFFRLFWFFRVIGILIWRFRLGSIPLLIFSRILLFLRTLFFLFCLFLRLLSGFFFGFLSGFLFRLSFGPLLPES